MHSPDGRRFVVRERWGEQTTDRICERLLIWRTDAVSTAIEENRPLPSSRVLVTHGSASDGGTIADLAWQDARHLRYLAADANGVVQAHLLDADTGRSVRVTASPTDVVAFATGSGITLYLAREPARSSGNVIGGADATIYALTTSLQAEAGSVRLFMRRGKTAELPIGDGYITSDSTISLSPDGHHAIVFQPEVAPPPHWRGYRTRTRGYTDISVRDARNPENAQRLRAMLVDVAAGKMRPLLDAPAGHLAGNAAPHNVFWVEGGRSVILSGGYLPRGAGEPLPKVDHPVIAEIDLASGRATAIADLPVAKPGERLDGAVSAIAYDAGSGVLTLARRVDGAFREERYSRQSGIWRMLPPRAAPSATAPPLRVWLAQNPTARPKLVAALGDGPARLLHDPTPELDRYSLGRQEQIHFRFLDQDREAALIYPVGYRPGMRYPLVVQTHGLGRDEFVIDGPYGITTAYAAQPLANQGFVVFQLPDIRTPGHNSPAEASENADYWKAAVDHAVAMGVADPARVGVIAFSRTGFHLLAALAKYPGLYKAASISDSVQYGSLAQILAAPARRDRIASHAENTSGAPFAVPLDRWVADRNWFYTSAASKTPLRVEAIGSPISMWETFAVRRMQGTPVDFIYYPNGSHVLIKPSERLASQGGSVDWFRFWLKGEEDADSAKSGQYRRWRAMRDHGDAAEIDSEE